MHNLLSHKMEKKQPNTQWTMNSLKRKNALKAVNKLNVIQILHIIDKSTNTQIKTHLVIIDILFTPSLLTVI